MLLVLGTVGITLFSEIPVAHACSCIPLTIEEAIDNADLIAEIRITDAEFPEEFGAGYYDAEVLRVWKGQPGNPIDFETQTQIPACGLGRIEVSTTLITWAHGSGDSYSASWCSLPQESTEEAIQIVEDKLGPPSTPNRPTQAPSDPPDPTGSDLWPPENNPTLWLGTAAVMLLAGLALLVWVAVQTRRSRATPGRLPPR